MLNKAFSKILDLIRLRTISDNRGKLESKRPIFIFLTIFAPEQLFSSPGIR